MSDRNRHMRYVHNQISVVGSSSHGGRFFYFLRKPFIDVRTISGVIYVRDVAIQAFYSSCLGQFYFNEITDIGCKAEVSGSGIDGGTGVITLKWQGWGSDIFNSYIVSSYEYDYDLANGLKPRVKWQKVGF